jgi:radical SAM protein with 4Fe4S-binding SPASM domain
MELPESLLNVLLENRITSISVSLDGTEQTHNWLRNNKTSYRKAINSLELIGRSELEIKEAVTCVNPRNMGELEQIAGTLIEKRISRWRLLRIFPSGRAINNRDILLTFSQTRQLLDWIAEKRSYYRKKGLKISYGCEGYMPVGLDRKVRDLPFFCRAGVNYASILSDGTITGCSNNNSRFHVGNIIRDDLASLWNKDFSIFRERGWARTGFCKNCPEFNNCGGSSIHLWNESDAGPAFCYLKDASIF